MTAPTRYATEATYTAPGQAWNGQPTKVALAGGLYVPNSILAAEQLNYVANDLASYRYTDWGYDLVAPFAAWSSDFAMSHNVGRPLGSWIAAGHPLAGSVAAVNPSKSASFRPGYAGQTGYGDWSSQGSRTPGAVVTLGLFGGLLQAGQHMCVDGPTASWVSRSAQIGGMTAIGQAYQYQHLCTTASHEIVVVRQSDNAVFYLARNSDAQTENFSITQSGTAPTGLRSECLSMGFESLTTSYGANQAFFRPYSGGTAWTQMGGTTFTPAAFPSRLDVNLETGWAIGWREDADLNKGTSICIGKGSVGALPHTYAWATYDVATLFPQGVLGACVTTDERIRGGAGFTGDPIVLIAGVSGTDIIMSAYALGGSQAVAPTLVHSRIIFRVNGLQLTRSYAGRASAGVCTAPFLVSIAHGQVSGTRSVLTLAG